MVLIHFYLIGFMECKEFNKHTNHKILLKQRRGKINYLERDFQAINKQLFKTQLFTLTKQLAIFLSQRVYLTYMYKMEIGIFIILTVEDKAFYFILNKINTLQCIWIEMEDLGQDITQPFYRDCLCILSFVILFSKRDLRNYIERFYIHTLLGIILFIVRLQIQDFIFIMTTQRNKKCRQLNIPQILKRFSINRNRVFQFDPNHIQISSIENHHQKRKHLPLVQSHKLISHQLSTKQLIQQEALQIDAKYKNQNTFKKQNKSKSQKKTELKKPSVSKNRNYLNLPSIKRQNVSLNQKHQDRHLDIEEQNQQQKLHYIFGKNQRIKNSNKKLKTIQIPFPLNKSRQKNELSMSKDRRSKHHKKKNEFLQKLQLSGKQMIGTQKQYQRNLTVPIDQKFSQKVNLLPSQLLFGNRRQDIVKNVYQQILKLF